MTDRTRNPGYTKESLGPLRQMTIDEPMSVWMSACCPEELGAALDACSELPRRGEVTPVLCLPREIQAADATRALAGAGSLADTLVLIATDEDRLYTHDHQATDNVTQQGEDR